ncbi:MAG: CehA/McbA family metallohydrolase [Chitinophagaceae bacterium]
MRHYYFNNQKEKKLLIFLLAGFIINAKIQGQKLDSAMYYIQSGDKPEWNEFDNHTPIKSFSIQFNASKNATEQTLRIRQYDVKQSWMVMLNGNNLGALISDMNDMVIYLPVPPGKLIDGINKLDIIPASPQPDDIMIGEVFLYPVAYSKMMFESHLEIEVFEKEKNTPIPCRLTIINSKRSLQTMAIANAGPVAFRPGNIYTTDGKFSVGLPSGEYTIFATRGFEYSVDSFHFQVRPGQMINKKLFISREVNTEGWISSDTHIHTYTYSGHGDATIGERAISIAGEGIELPVMTDHNIKVSIAPLMDSLNLGNYYTPVTGMEFTTNLGHFNVFPEIAGAPVPGYQLKNWDSVTPGINPSDDRVVILNHARDIHKEFRPFDPGHHVAIAGYNLDGWQIPANAMEIVNSGSLQTNMFQLMQDWFGMMNRGYYLTPVGSSDSHDVSRYIVGQARTYIECNDEMPGKIDINEAIKNFKAGKVAVSMGLLPQITVNDQYGAGDLVPKTDQIKVSVKVLGPGWTNVNKVSLYANGKKIQEAIDIKTNIPGLKWEGTWILPKFNNDVFIVAVAEGPYSFLPYWPLVKPFQPASNSWIPQVMGLTGAVWIDSDGDGNRTSAFHYATEAWKKSNNDIGKFIFSLDGFDEATGVQAASVLDQQKRSFKRWAFKKAVQKASPEIRLGIQNYMEERIK